MRIPSTPARLDVRPHGSGEMPLNLGNAQEIVATKISLIQGNAVNDILSIIAAGGGSGTVTSATAPLSISSTGVLTVDLAAYATSAAVNSLLANYTLTSALFAGVSVGAGLSATANAGSLSLALTGTESRVSLRLADSGGTVRQLTSTTGGVLAWEAAPVALATDLANKIDAITVAAPLAISGTGTSRALSLQPHRCRERRGRNSRPHPALETFQRDSGVWPGCRGE